TSIKAVVRSEQQEPNNGIVLGWFYGHDVHMIRVRHQQPSLWEGLFAEEVAELWEQWMRVVDELLEDDALVDAVYEAQGNGVSRAGRWDGHKRRRRWRCAC